MPFCFWTCAWCSLFTVLVSVFDLCALMRHVTMFSEDIFAGLISLIFIIDGARPIIENFTESRLTLTNCVFEAPLCHHEYASTMAVACLTVWSGAKLLREVRLADLGCQFSLGVLCSRTLKSRGGLKEW